MFLYRGQEGREILEECLLITERHKGKEHPSLVTHMVNLATSYSRSKNYVEAEHLLRRSLGIMTKQKGTDDQSITFPMLQLAVTLYHLKRDEEAEQLALDALHIREKAFGENSLPVGKLSSPSLNKVSSCGHIYYLYHQVLLNCVGYDPISHYSYNLSCIC